VSATITGRVVDVLDNGNLVVEGRRNIVLGDNTKTILITGIARAGDIDAGNAVRSERLHNFSVAIEGEGPLSRAEREGILSRLIDILWPL
jgi:flagellar L-ring protein precursor FlgH